MTPVLSILVPTVPGREPKLARLLEQLDRQVDVRDDTELIVLRDSRGMSIGAKRNAMLQLARGTHVAFVDDDDRIADDYVATIVDALQARPDLDVLCFRVMVHGHGPPLPTRFHPDFAIQNTPTEYLRKPNHIMVWRREIAVSVPFPAVSFGEDTLWSETIAPLAQRVETIDRVLYDYMFDPADNSGTARG